MIAILPVSLPADDATAAMLRSNGVGVRVNENPAPASIALFADDLIETQKSAVARIEASGSTADINPETMVQFERRRTGSRTWQLVGQHLSRIEGPRGLRDSDAREPNGMDTL